MAPVEAVKRRIPYHAVSYLTRNFKISINFFSFLTERAMLQFRLTMVVFYELGEPELQQASSAFLYDCFSRLLGFTKNLFLRSSDHYSLNYGLIREKGGFF